VGVDDPARALALLEGLDQVREAHRSDEGVRVTLEGGPELAAVVNAKLVGAGLAVARLEPVRQSLEQRFLEVTSRLDADPAEVGA
jgi:ABC-2 type transport system ATP-binding protein